MRITWEQTGDEFPTRWDSNCVRRSTPGVEWSGRIRACEKFFLVEVFHGSCPIFWEQRPTLAEAKRRGAEVMRALCGGPELKTATVWCGVTPKGRVMIETASTTRGSAWWAIVYQCAPKNAGPKQAREAGYTVRKFRLEEVR